MAMAMVVTVIAVRAVNMHGLGSGRWFGCMAMRMPARAVRAALGLKGFIHFIDDQVHGAQHVGQHMVGLDFQVIGFELNRYVTIAQVVSRAGQVKQRAM